MHFAVEDGRIAWREDNSRITEGHKNTWGTESSTKLTTAQAKQAKEYLKKTVHNHNYLS